jgi:hypothetical protein
MTAMQIEEFTMQISKPFVAGMSAQMLRPFNMQFALCTVQ